MSRIKNLLGFKPCLKDLVKSDPLLTSNDVGITVLHKVARGELDASNKTKYLKNVKKTAKFQDYLDRKDKSGFTALHRAVQSKNYEFLNLLLKAGANPNVLDNCGRTAAFLACFYKYYFCASLLLESMAYRCYVGTDPNIIKCNAAMAYLIGETFSKMSYVDMSFYIGELLFFYARIPTDDGIQLFEALIEMVIGIEMEIVREQIKRKAYIKSLRNRIQYFSAMIKDDRGRMNLIKPLENKISCCDAVIEYNNRRVNIVEICDVDGNTFLHYAVIVNNNMRRVELLVDAGWEINSKNRFGLTPLDIALGIENYEYVLFLLEKHMVDNIEINAHDVNELLHFCTSFSTDSDLIKYLLGNGADVNSCNNDGNIPLHNAVMIDNNTRNVKLLISAGSKIILKNHSGLTPLDIALERGNYEYVLFLLEKHMVDNIEINTHKINTHNVNELLHFCATFSTDSDLIVYLLVSGADVNSCNNNDGNIPLHNAVMIDNNTRNVKLLISAGSEIMLKNHSGLTPLDIVIRNERFEYMKYLLLNPMYSLLEEYVRDNNGKFFLREKELVFNDVKFKFDYELVLKNFRKFLNCFFERFVTLPIVSGFLLNGVVECAKSAIGGFKVLLPSSTTQIVVQEIDEAKEVNTPETNTQVMSVSNLSSIGSLSSSCQSLTMSSSV